jgi:type IV pilus assembly protein PilB
MTEKDTRSKTPPKIGELLVQEGFVTQDQIDQALDIQRREAETAKNPLGKLLVQNGLISKEQLRQLLDHPYLRKNFGTLAIEKGFLTREQLDACLVDQKHSDLPIGKLLLSQGLITEGDVRDVLNIQVGGTKIGELALKIGMIQQADLDRMLEIQQHRRTLGEILCDLKLIAPEDLSHVLQKYNKQMRLGDILLKENIIDEEKLNDALQEQRQWAQPLGKILFEKKYVTKEQLYRALSRQYNLSFKPLTGFTIGEFEKQTLVQIVREKYAEKNQILPLSLEGNTLELAVSSPDHQKVLPELKSLYPQLRMTCTLITDDKFDTLFHSLYGRSFHSDGLSSLDAEDTEKKIDGIQLDMTQVPGDRDGKTDLYGQTDMEAEEVVNFIIKYGITKGASDIHIEQDRKGLKLRYRLDGVLQQFRQEWLTTKLQDMAPAIISRIKVMSNLDIAEKRVPQDGVFRVNFFDTAVKQKVDLDFRVASCPAIVGENITIRILDQRKAKVGLDKLDHSPHVLEGFKRLLKSSAGMVLVSGPTGSGKSSTLYGALQYIYNPGIKIITAEDPIEYSFPGIMQTQINPKIGVTFSRLLRSFLRFDPDVIFVGEMRDKDTASIGFDAAQTGHLLLSTIHTNDSIAAVSRLADLGVEQNQVASCLLGVLAQRLVRRTCPMCSSQYIPEEQEWSFLFHTYPSHLKFYRGKGCEQCDFSGYKGRTLISEFFEVNKEVAHALNCGATERELKPIALANGMKTMIDDSLLKLERITLSEIIRVVPHEMIKEFKSRQTSGKPEPTPVLATSGKAAAPAAKNGAFTIQVPENERDTVQQMFSRFCTLRKIMGAPIESENERLFFDFITHHHQTLTRRFGCQSINFFIEQQSDGVKILGYPAS